MNGREFKRLLCRPQCCLVTGAGAVTRRKRALTLTLCAYRRPILEETCDSTKYEFLRNRRIFGRNLPENRSNEDGLLHAVLPSCSNGRAKTAMSR
jgi:hypothetical protein